MVPKIYRDLSTLDLFKRQSKNRAFFKIIELLLWFKTPPRTDPGKGRGAKTRPQEQLECANPPGSPGGEDGQAWN